ncbi:MAG: hypothetical protein ACJ76W_04950 [Chloroflexota bacterium]
MTDIYLDPIAAGMPDAADQLRHLTDTGHRVIVVGELPGTMTDEPSIGSVDALPDAPTAGSWLLTADPELCADRRPPLQSLLVGPRPAPSPRPTPRCDADARDLAAAVLEILSREAMG